MSTVKSWQEQIEQMLGTWTQAQRRLWDHWLEAVKDFNGLPQGSTPGRWQGYQDSLDAWERSVKRALDAQQAWTRSWTEPLLGEEQAPESTLRWARQIQETMRGWSEAQKQLWNAWFDSIKGMDPEAVNARWETEGQEIIRAWQEATQRAQDALDEWMRSTGGEAIRELPPARGNTAARGRLADRGRQSAGKG